MTHRMGILSGSLIAGIAGDLILLFSRPAVEKVGGERVTEKVFSEDSFGPDETEAGFGYSGQD